MGRIQVLDCTLRDGGYCNDCRFGYENKKKIINALMDAGINIIECGFYRDDVSYDPDTTRFSSVEQIGDLIPEHRKDTIFVVLADYGTFDPVALPEYDGSSVDGFRIAFHRKNYIQGVKTCRKVKEKGYKIFVQAMVSLSYSDREFLDLIGSINELEPYAFYIVDSFGTMKRKDLIRLFSLVEHNLKPGIRIGFHSHNNMQMSYSNAQCLTEMQTSRDLIIDSSVYGMGRGAGNLNTELFVQYLNENAEGEYRLKPLLTIIDEILNGIYQRSPWGYTLSNYLSAKHNAHPNYALYLDDRKTLTVEAMDEIFSMMSEDKKCEFDREYVEMLYQSYMNRGSSPADDPDRISLAFAGKDVLLIAPGRSSEQERETIAEFIRQEKPVTVSINFAYPHAKTDYIFVSNLRRYKALPQEQLHRCIVTSNIQAADVCLRTDYAQLLSAEEPVTDNAGLMAVKFMILSGAKQVCLAGFDGYAHEDSENYGSPEMELITRNDILDAMNKGMTRQILEYGKKIPITFLTEERFLKIAETDHQDTQPDSGN